MSLVADVCKSNMISAFFYIHNKILDYLIIIWIENYWSRYFYDVFCSWLTNHRSEMVEDSIITTVWSACVVNSWIMDEDCIILRTVQHSLIHVITVKLWLPLLQKLNLGIIYRSDFLYLEIQSILLVLASKEQDYLSLAVLY